MGRRGFKEALRFSILAVGLAILAAGCESSPTRPSSVSDSGAPATSGTIPAQTVTAGGPRGQVDVAPYFRDPDGDALSYAATSSDTQVADVSVTDSTVNVRAHNPGQATVTVTARDPSNLSARQSFAVTAEAPRAGGVCAAGLELRPGEFCSVDIPGIDVDADSPKRFENSNGRGCYTRFCATLALNINGFGASRIGNSDDWRIDTLP